MSRKRQHQDVDESSDQAVEEQERIQESEQNRIFQEEQKDADDLENDDEADYEQISALDHYERGSADDEEHSEDLSARRRAQEELNREGRVRVREGDDIDDLMEDEEIMYERRLRQKQQQILADEDEQQIDERRFIDPEESKGKLKDWIHQEQTLKYIKVKFTRFITSYKGVHQYAIYAQKLKQMAINNRQSIQVSFDQMKAVLQTISIWVGLYPAIILPILSTIVYNLACKYYPSYKTIVPEAYVKISDLPFTDNIRDLRFIHLGKLVKIKGVITIRTQVLNQMKRVTYKCAKCGEPKGPFIINQSTNLKMGICSSCQSTGPFFQDKSKTLYRNYQKMTIQQSPSDVLPGRIPRSKQILVYGDNVDVARPGDQVQIIGIFTNRYDCNLNIKQGFPLFTTFIQVNYIIKCADNETMGNDKCQQEQFIKLSKDPKIAQKIYGSIAPSIYGHDFVKRGLTLAMFGGVAVQGTHRVRGDINVLLLGDPGIAKSQFLKSIQKVFHRCIYTTGKGASAVGLTASVKRDFQTNQWKLQAGALVLADKGICLIDQFDKMNEHDRTSIHEAMEQQSISISKAGIVTSLRARCSVIAAANPVQGRYNSALSFSDNVDLSDPILSRFDILNVIKDQIDKKIDYKLATFVINSHIRNHPYNQKYQIDNLEVLADEEQTLPYIEHKRLRQYIKYAREKCFPQLGDKYLQLIKKFFGQLRKASKDYGGMHVSVRQIQSIIRLSKAHAKLHLRNQVQKRDVDVGIQVMMQSFIQTQKTSTAKDLRKKFKNYLYVSQ